MKRRVAKPVFWSERAYRSVLLCYPSEFRYEYGQEMALAFRNRCYREHSRHGIAGLAWLWFETAADLMSTAPKEHCQVLTNDIRYGLRMLALNPAFTAIAVLTLALGIGANTAIFSLLDAMVLHPLPYADAQRLVQIWEGDRRQGITNWESNPPDFLDWRARSRSFEQIAGYQHAAFNLVGSGEPSQVQAARVTYNFFETLAVRPRLGRIFTADEEQQGAAVIVAGYGLWHTSLNSDPNIVGKTILVDGLPRTVVGVLPEDFVFSHLGPAALFAPMTFTPRELEPQARRAHWLYVIGRLKPEVTLEQAQAEMEGIADGMRREHPDTNQNSGVIVITLREQVARFFQSALVVVFGAAGLVLLIACANIASLLLARSSVRQREIGIRLVIGAGRLRIVRQLVTESVLLFALGGAAGIALGIWGTHLLAGLVPYRMHAYLPRSGVVEVNNLVLLFSVLVSLGTGLIFGLAPAWTASRQDPIRATREGGPRNSGGGAGRALRSLMVVSEVALALVLAIGAGLLAKTFITLQTTNHGFQPDQVVTVGVQLPAKTYATTEQTTQFFDRLLESIGGLPGVQAAGIVDHVPFLGSNSGGAFQVDGRPAPAERETPGARLRVVSSGYFDAMRVPLVGGRWFTSGDTLTGAPVVVVSQALAARYFRGENPIGRGIRMQGAADRRLEIVGIVGDVRHSATEPNAAPYIYFPYSQNRTRGTNVVVRTAGDPGGIVPSVRAAVSSIDKTLPVAQALTMREVMAINMVAQRVSSVMVSGFAVLALILALVGIYGILSYVVTQRTQEVGIRMALGASRAGVALLMLRQSLTLVGIGLAIGTAASLGLSRLIAGMLFGVKPTDPLIYGGVIGLMVSAAVVASLIPARRATAVNPVVALKYE